MDFQVHRDDYELFSGLINNNQKDFEQLFRAYYASLCDYAYAILGDYAEAEDVVQYIFIYLWNSRKKIKIESSIKSYLYSSVRYRSLNILRHRVVMRQNNPVLIDFIEKLQQEGYSEEEELKIEKINKALESLTPQSRIVFTMSCLEGKTYKEIARELGISVHTVKFHISNAYRHIRQKVDSDRDILLLLLIIKNYFRLL